MKKRFRPLLAGFTTLSALVAVLGSTAPARADTPPSATPLTSFTTLTLLNGWSGAPFGTGTPAVSNVGGIVHFRGAMAGGTTAQAFVLLSGFRPATDVYVPVDLCNAHKGRLLITPDGSVSVQAESAFTDAQCFTSLDGASFVIAGSPLVPLTLQNGWTNAPFSTNKAAITTYASVIYFQGAIATGGTNPVPFTLPTGWRPAVTTYIPIDLCNATNGRLIVDPSGAVTVGAETSFSDAQCFTSLDGAFFSLNATSYTPLTLQNGWAPAPFGTRAPAVRNVSGIITLQGAMATVGTTATAFTLPVGFRPASDAYVNVDLCNSTKGRLVISTNGSVDVQAETSFSDAQCFTSLEGASFALAPTAQFVPLTLVNGWKTSPYTTADPAVANISGVVTLRGAMSTTGTVTQAFTLPVGDRPAATVYLPIDLCNAKKGRLQISPTGDASVQAEGSFANAQCFTSLDGASFVVNSGGQIPLTPVNGWTGGPFATSSPAAVNIAGVVHLKGAISTAGTNPQAFVLPVGYRPPAPVYVPVDLCNATNGRLVIDTSGNVSVQAETSFSNASCFTSLDGASFTANPAGYTPLTLTTGWTNSPFGTGSAAVVNIAGVVHFKGAIATTGTATSPFVLPAQFKPTTNVFLNIDLCNATKGRLFIQTNGVAIIQAETVFSNAQCFTSLDGASFVQ